MVAPNLFNCVIDPGVQEGSGHVIWQLPSDLKYVDDTTMFCSSLQHLSSTHTTYHEEAAKLGLHVSWQKTKLMYVCDEPGPPPLCIGSKAVDFVSSFVYLGSTITNNGNLKPKSDCRCGLAATAMQSLWKPLWHHHRLLRYKAACL